MTGPLSLRLAPALAERLGAQLPVLADEILAAISREVPAYARPLEGAYRTGARVAWARLAELGLQAGLPARELVELAAAVFAYIDELSAASAEGFTAEQSVLAGDRERRRRRLVQLLLSEAPLWQLEEAAIVAGWSPPVTLTAVLVPAGARREVLSRWDERALAAADDDAVESADSGGTAMLLLPDADGPGQSERLTRLLAGRPCVVGLPRSWHEARLSVALVRRAAGTGVAPVRAEHPAYVEDHLAALVVGADPLALAELSARRLAPFQALTARGRERLLDTLRAWLAHQGDRRSVAVELGIHPQTVRYRVGLLREVLNGDLDDPRRRFELALVLPPTGC